jgi:hypothetical protein
MQWIALSDDYEDDSNFDQLLGLLQPDDSKTRPVSNQVKFVCKLLYTDLASNCNCKLVMVLSRASLCRNWSFFGSKEKPHLRLASVSLYTSKLLILSWLR